MTKFFQELRRRFRRWKLRRWSKKYNKKPKRCIDPCMKYCQGCRWGYCIYPEDTTRDDINSGFATFESGCTLGFEDMEPTKREQRKFDKAVEKFYKAQETIKDDEDSSFFGFDPDDSPTF